MSETQRTPRPMRQHLSVRIDRTALAAIERAAEERRTTPAHIARILLEDAALQLDREVA
jgi:hypothetical protein